MILTDPPFDVLKKDADFISTLEMDAVCANAMNLLKPNGVLFLFCSHFQICNWFQAIESSGLKTPIIFSIIPKAGLETLICYF